MQGLDVPDLKKKKKMFQKHSEFVILEEFLRSIRWFVCVCVEVLQPSQPNEVMLSLISLLNHTLLLGKLSPLSG